MIKNDPYFIMPEADSDPLISQALNDQRARQQNQIELIERAVLSPNYTISFLFIRLFPVSIIYKLTVPF